MSMKTLKLFSILVIALGMMSCSKDDDDDNSVTVEELQGLNYYPDSENEDLIVFEWDTYDLASTYSFYINGEENENSAKITSTKTYAYFYDLDEEYSTITTIEYGDVLTIEAYNGTTLVATAEITYGVDADENQDNDQNDDEDEDQNDDVEVGEITGIQVMYMNYSYTLLWDAYSDAIEYYVYLNGTKISDIPYTGASAKLDELSEGDLIEIKAYSDFDEEELIATGSYTYSEN